MEGEEGADAFHDGVLRSLVRQVIFIGRQVALLGLEVAVAHVRVVEAGDQEHREGCGRIAASIQALSERLKTFQHDAFSRPRSLPQQKYSMLTPGFESQFWR